MTDMVDAQQESNEGQGPSLLPVNVVDESLQVRGDMTPHSQPGDQAQRGDTGCTDPPHGVAMKSVDRSLMQEGGASSAAPLMALPPDGEVLGHSLVGFPRETSSPGIDQPVPGDDTLVRLADDVDAIVGIIGTYFSLPHPAIGGGRPLRRRGGGGRSGCTSTSCYGLVF